MKHRIQKSLHQYPKTGHQTSLPAAEHWNKAWKPKSSSSLGVFLLSFTVDRGLWLSQAWQELCWGRGTRLSPLRSSEQRFSPRNPLNRNFNVFDRVSPPGTAGVVPREQQGCIRQYRTCRGAAGVRGRPRRGWWRCFWGTRRVWAAWPAASPAGPL